MVSEQDMSDINSLLTTAVLTGDKDPDDKTLGGTNGDVARQRRPGTAVVGKATVGEARPFSAAEGLQLRPNLYFVQLQSEDFISEERGFGTEQNTKLLRYL
ncbi:unnamed protein product [Lampetra planeri]